MADKPAEPKRRVKNPETFRERALKASADEGIPKKRRLRQASSKVTSPVARAGSSILATKPAQVMRKPASMVGKVVVPPYLRNSWQELRLVNWPSWRQSRKLTVAVLIFAIVFGLVIAGVDWVVDKIFRNILLS
jgi:preprotein translocase SecE subunit